MKKLFLFIIIMLMSVNVFSLQGEKKEKSEIELHRKKEIKSTYEIAKKSLEEKKVKKESIDIFLKGLEYIFNQNNEKKAKELFLEAIKLDENNDSAKYYLKKIYEIEENRNLIKANPKNPMPYFELVLLYETLLNDKEKENMEKQINTLFPDFPQVLLEKATEILDADTKESYVESIKYFKEAIEKSKNKYFKYIPPETRDAYIFSSQMGIVTNYLLLHEYDEAVKHLEKYYPDMKRINENLMLYYFGSLFLGYNEEYVKPKNENLYNQNMEKLSQIFKVD